MQQMVFEYGLLQPTKNGDLVDEQIRLAHRYYNQLIEIERSRRTAYRSALSKHGDVASIEEEIAKRAERLGELRSSIKASKATGSTCSPAEVLMMREKAKTLSAELKDKRASLKELRKRVREDAEIQKALETLEQVHHERAKRARADCGVYWGTYLLIEQAIQAARGARVDPSFKSWNEDGAVAVQVQGGMGADEVFGGDTRIQVDPIDPAAWSRETRRGVRRRLSRTELRLRIGSDGRDPIWAAWPMVMHRPLPEGSRVKGVRVIRRRVQPQERLPRGAKRSGRPRYRWCRWTVQFTVEVPTRVPAPRHRGVVSIDVGWRAMKGGLRVAVCIDNEGRTGELRLPWSIRDRLDKANAIRSVRDQVLDDLRPKVVEALGRAELDDGLREVLRFIPSWRSPARFLGLLSLEGLPDELVEMLEAWRRRDLHLHQYERGLRDSAVRHRRDIYRCFAARMARYESVILESFDLRKVTRKPAPESDRNDVPQGPARQRVIASVSTLRNALASTLRREGVDLLELDAANTTRRCSACKHVNDWPDGYASRDVVLTCQACGAEWDQDENAARNLLASGLATLKDPEALAAAMPTKKERKPRFAKRHKPKSRENIPEDDRPLA